MRALIFVLGIVAAVLALFLLVLPREAANLTDGGWARLIYLLLILVMFAGGAISVRRGVDGAPVGKGPGVLLSLAIWLAILVVIVLIYRASWFWAGVTQMFSG